MDMKIITILPPKTLLIWYVKIAINSQYLDKECNIPVFLMCCLHLVYNIFSLYIAVYKYNDYNIFSIYALK